MDDKKKRALFGLAACTHCVASSATTASTKGAENAERPVVGKTTHTRTWHPGGLCDFKGHGRQSRVIKATRYDWLLATTNVDWARTLQDFRLTDSFSESVRRLLSWSVQQHTNVLASLRPAYISRLTPKCRMICRLTPKSCVQSANVR